MQVVHVGNDADDAMRPYETRLCSVSSGDEFEHGIGPIDMLADGIPGSKHAAREGLGDDSDRLLNLVILRIEIAAFENGHAERGEKAGGDGAPHRARIVFAMDVAISRKLQTWAEVVGIAPWSNRAESGGSDAR